MHGTILYDIFCQADMIRILAVALCTITVVYGLIPPKISFSPTKGLRTMSRSMPIVMSASVGIVGATGAVGEEIRKVMEDRAFPASSMTLFASDKSAGKVVKSSRFGDIKMEAFSFEAASKLDVLLLAVGGDFSLEWAEKLLLHIHSDV